MVKKSKKSKKSVRQKKVKVLGPTFEKGKPEGEDEGKWRPKLQTREEKLKYLQVGERYFYGEGYGSEKRKKPA